MQLQSSLSRGLALFDLLSLYPKGLRFSELKRAMGDLSPTTLTKVLKELVGFEVLSKNENNRYAFGDKFFLWSFSLPHYQPFLKEAEKALKFLNVKLNVTTALYVPQGDKLFCRIRYTEANSPALIDVGVSTVKAPVSFGGPFLFPKKDLEDDFKLDALIKRFPNSKASLNQVKEIIELSNKEGIMDDMGYCFKGVWRLSIPIYNKNNVVGVLCLGINPVHRIEKDFKNHAMQYLKHTKRILEKRTGYVAKDLKQEGGANESHYSYV